MSINISGTQLQGIPVMINTTSGLLTSTDTGNNATDLTKNAATNLQAVQSTSSQQLSIAQQNLQSFWQTQQAEIQKLTVNDFKTQDLPLARIKKIMKMDEEVKMISAEAPLLFARAAQIFITGSGTRNAEHTTSVRWFGTFVPDELSLRAWIHTEESKRRTLQRNDIATAITKFDQFDFLIDIVPREELKPARKTVTGSDGLSYYYTVPQSAVSSANNANVTAQASFPQGQIVLTQPNNQNQPSVITPFSLDGNQVLQIIQNPQQNTPGNNTINREQSNEQTSSGNQPQAKQQTILQGVAETSEQQNNINAQEIHTIGVNANGQIQLFKVQSNDNTQSSLQDQVLNLATMSQTDNNSSI